jgi:hypothetical protein
LSWNIHKGIVTRLSVTGWWEISKVCCCFINEIVAKWKYIPILNVIWHIHYLSPNINQFLIKLRDLNR